jgi:hypothetical protein
MFEYLGRIEPVSHDRVVVVPWLFAENLVPAAVTALLLSVPIAWVYGRGAPWIGLLLTVPFVAVRLFLLPADAKPLAVALCWSTIVSYVVFVIGAIMLARRVLVSRRSNLGMKAPPAA